MELPAVAAFALIAVTLILVPGPDWALCSPRVSANVS
jgi:threonine/homoserine/homoserine lactone efflux protein